MRGSTWGASVPNLFMRYLKVGLRFAFVFAGPLACALGCSASAAPNGPAVAGNAGAPNGVAGAAHAGASGASIGGAAGGSLAGAGSVAAGASSAGGGGVLGAAGSAGSSAGTAGSAGASGAGAGPVDCSSLPLCDTFESTAAQAPPNPALWTLVPSAATGTATVDTMGAHGSQHSLKVVSPDRLYLRNSTVIGTLGPIAHVRFFVRFATPLADGHGALIVTHPVLVDQYTQGNELRFGSQGSVFHWNTDSDSANLPDVSPNGNAASFKPAAATWYCVELTVNTNGHLDVSIDGTAVPGLMEDGSATPDIDKTWVNDPASLNRYKALADFNFGWQSYGGGALTLWYDDIALSASPIGCQ